MLYDNPGSQSCSWRNVPVWPPAWCLTGPFDLLDPFTLWTRNVCLVEIRKRNYWHIRMRLGLLVIVHARMVFGVGKNVYVTHLALHDCYARSACTH